ncbi:hypothetical protein ARMSODRAFT_602587 [Armillaria solidipes]|uniref:Uncharacterized protein n=1 Tax=Armillaria solidipes TaxID=1076256 RepID=A0A2H3AUU3_9AGAR|nr:hypothetical protein ARMSODRAFT_602587 [Armillaria solidipes]
MDSADKRYNTLSDGKPTADWEVLNKRLPTWIYAPFTLCIVKNGTFSGPIGPGTTFDDFSARSGAQVFRSSLEVCGERHRRTPSASLGQLWFCPGLSAKTPEHLLRTRIRTAITDSP